MQTENKRIAKNTVFLYTRMLLIMAVSLYTSRVVLRELGIEDYGLYSVVGAIVVFLGSINNSMSGATQRFLSFYQGKNNPEELSSTFSSVSVVQFCISTIILLIGETAGPFYIEHYLNVSPDKITTAHIVYQFSLFSFLTKTLTVPYTASIISNERMNVFALFSIVEALLQLAVVVILKVLSSDKLIIYAMMMFATVFTVQMCYRIYCIRHFRECHFKRNWNRTTVKNIFSYSGWNLLGSLSSVAIDQGVNMILNSFFGVVVNAARGIAFQVSGAIASLSGNFQQAINPQIVKTFACGEMGKMHQLVMKGTKFCYFLLLLISLPVLFNMNALLGLWLGDVPDYAVTFCILVLINSLISSFSGCLLMGAMATGRIRKYQIIVAGINLMNFPLSLIALHYYPNPYVTVYIMISVSIAAFIARLILTSRMIQMSIREFLGKVFIPASATTLLAVFLVWSTNTIISDNELIMVFAKMSLSFAFVAISIMVFGLNRNERKLAADFVKRKFAR